MQVIDKALEPAVLHTRPENPEYSDSHRRWQGIPSIEVTRKGRVFVAFFGGQQAEKSDNVILLSASENCGDTFRSCEAVVDHPDPEIRLYDPNVWLDPLGRLWLFWSQTRYFNDGRNGVWASVCESPDADRLHWSTPRRIANGIMLNKPIVTGDGAWLFPCALWCDACTAPPQERHGLEAEQFSNVYVSHDQGRTISLLGGADVPNRAFDEHMVVERRDGSLWMLVRTYDGIGESFSTDGGRTWSPGRKAAIAGPCSRFHIRRLRSGRLLLLNHYRFTEQIDIGDVFSQDSPVKKWKGRSHLTALLSEDDGRTWPHALLLDERDEVAYPDAKEAEDGYIYATYDHQRVTRREILMARFTEEDILRGRVESPAGRLRMLVNRATGQPDVE